MAVAQQPGIQVTGCNWIPMKKIWKFSKETLGKRTRTEQELRIEMTGLELRGGDLWGDSEMNTKS